MGRAAPRRATSAVASALFTPVQQRVLGLLFGQPERRFQSAELIRLAGSGTGAVHRQLQRLEQAGLVTTDRRTFLVYENYDAILRYNCAHYYALTVALLADQIR